ncbi:MAG: dihydroorotate dehydrogenase-like protein [Myxococcales bacterium]|nr:MAG: dihydroorotate dehydrogenase-like protein [Myxococcales bacterium]
MDLSTNYLGLKLENPLVPSSSPLMRSRDDLKRMEDAGAAAVVLHSLFEEQITQESHNLDGYLNQGAEISAEAISYFPEAPDYQTGPAEYLEHLAWAKKSLSIPVIGSLNGISNSGWIDYAKNIEQSGADALELNVYYLATDLGLTGLQVETMYLDILKHVRSAVSIPIAMKLSPYFSSTAHMAKQLTDAGVNGLVLFNRFYQPDLDPETLEVVPHLVLSGSDELRLPLRWIAILYGRIQADLALTTGVHRSEDVIKGLMAGAKITMMASELLRNGIGRITELRSELQEWLIEHEYESVKQMQGSMSQMNCAEPGAFERANYMRVLSSFSTDTL